MKRFLIREPKRHNLQLVWLISSQSCRKPNPDPQSQSRWPGSNSEAAAAPSSLETFLSINSLSSVPPLFLPSSSSSQLLFATGESSAAAVPFASGCHSQVSGHTRGARNVKLNFTLSSRPFKEALILSSRRQFHHINKVAIRKSKTLTRKKIAHSLEFQNVSTKPKMPLHSVPTLSLLLLSVLGLFPPFPAAAWIYPKEGGAGETHIV